MTTKTATIREIAKSNYLDALDQQHEPVYDSPARCIAAYRQNTIDTASEAGYEPHQCGQAALIYDQMMSKHIDVVVGAGVTACWHRDNHACTVIAVSRSKKTVTVQRDKATRTSELKFDNGGFLAHASGRQMYSYEPDPNGVKRVFTLRKSGRFVLKGQPLKTGAKLIRGRHEYYDFNF